MFPETPRAVYSISLVWQLGLWVTAYESPVLGRGVVDMSKKTRLAQWSNSEPVVDAWLALAELEKVSVDWFESSGAAGGTPS